MSEIANSKVAEIFNTYPEPMRQRLMHLRQLILDTASETQEAGALEETLKWREPSYITKSGSTIRLDWKSEKPEQYALYFNCKTQLIDTFKTLYGDIFQYDGNRALIFSKNDELPLHELKHCISLALTYHLRKKRPTLGM